MFHIFFTIIFLTKLFAYFNVKHTIWLMSYQNGNHIEPSEQWLQEISIAKNWPCKGFEPAAFGFLVHWSNCISLFRKVEAVV